MIGYGAKSFRIAARPVAERSRGIRMKCSLLRRRQRFSRPTINPRDRSTKGKRRSTGLVGAGTVGGADDERAAADGLEWVSFIWRRRSRWRVDADDSAGSDCGWRSRFRRGARLAEVEEDPFLVGHHDIGPAIPIKVHCRNLGAHAGVVVNQVRHECYLAVRSAAQFEP